MLEVTCNDRLGKKVRVKCNPDDTIGDLKKLIAAQTGTRWEKIVLKKWYTIFKDHIKLQDCILFLQWYFLNQIVHCTCILQPNSNVMVMRGITHTEYVPEVITICSSLFNNGIIVARILWVRPGFHENWFCHITTSQYV